MKIPIETHNVRNIFRQIMLGFNDLAKNGLIHRNLKPQNFFLNFRKAGPMIDKIDYYQNKLNSVDVYIKDFTSIVQVNSNTKKFETESLNGNPQYWAKEMIDWYFNSRPDMLF